MSLGKHLSKRLADGHVIPVLGFGTSAPPKVTESDVEEATERAISAGYRHIDTAYIYQNEKAIGRALQKKMADGAVTRDDLFCTTKVWSTFLRPELVRTSLEMSLKKLQLSYVDLYLIHFPVALKPGEEMVPKDAQGRVVSEQVDLRATWEAMEACKKAGLARSIGVSNFNCRQLELILNKPGLQYKPVCNQVECHPYLNQSQLLSFCRSKDIVLVAYGALGSDSGKTWVSKDLPVLLQDPVIKAIADKRGRTPAQVALRFQLQRGLVVLAKSFNEQRMRENLQAFDFQLTSEDMQSLEGLNRNWRYFPETSFRDSPNYPYFDEY
ncbi:aldo-keto reductase family 1 member C3 homolog isoform X1 [Rousettus aegyptiacus]|uniref:aldo-keto reductase family 1 member C3 homolog isoform X1 n=1 Tax=Rousettus aegyptiacus TaxID=9407 RepID=UPI00168CDBE8|nr:aldo-keto reductase family 1 member C3 homolog isoform X1 [Rousettus aegyptiacus]XP_036084114.1 aldo-keto reductase family 1 member C3 homolog isoform X1 [Rousettus aegyptiacus]XP_036084115.1 aldo-keto reductase family 1 member C3 homolog isoform X1 [Rousettus aegyptiacus]